MDSKIQILIQSYNGKTIVESFSKSTKIYEILDILKKHNVSNESIYLTFNSKILKKVIHYNNIILRIMIYYF